MFAEKSGGKLIWKKNFLRDGKTKRCCLTSNWRAKEASGFLLRILETLPARQQEVLQLKFQNDLSYEEISEITELSVNYVGVLLYAALKTLRERYARTAREFVQFRRGANL